MEVAPIPTVFFVGPSKSGKTTTIETLLPKLEERGLTVGSVKAMHHNLTFDPHAKDSQRHRQAGSRFTICLAPTETGIIVSREERDSFDVTNDFLTNLTGTVLPKVDLLICESYNNPPPNSAVVLTAYNINDLNSYVKNLQSPQLLAVCGEITNSQDEWTQNPNVPFFNILKDNDSQQLLTLIIDRFF